MSMITTSFGAWAGSGVGQPSTGRGETSTKCRTVLYGTRAGTKRGGFISEAVRKGCDAGGQGFWSCRRSRLIAVLHVVVPAGAVGHRPAVSGKTEIAGG